MLEQVFEVPHDVYDALKIDYGTSILVIVHERGDGVVWLRVPDRSLRVAVLESRHPRLSSWGTPRLRVSRPG